MFARLLVMSFYCIKSTKNPGYEVSFASASGSLRAETETRPGTRQDVRIGRQLLSHRRPPTVHRQRLRHRQQLRADRRVHHRGRPLDLRLRQQSPPTVHRWTFRSNRAAQGVRAVRTGPHRGGEFRVLAGIDVLALGRPSRPPGRRRRGPGSFDPEQPRSCRHSEP